MIGMRESAVLVLLSVLCVFVVGDALGWPGTVELAFGVLDLFIVLSGVRLLFCREDAELPVRRMTRQEWRENRLRIRTQRSFAYYGQLPPPDDE